MNHKQSLPVIIGLVLFGLLGSSLRPAPAADLVETNLVSLTLATPKAYVLAPNDLVLVKVYRQDDLESRVRLAANGNTTFPLLGTINLGGKTLEEATTQIRELLAKDYLVNPQVTLTILEYAKRRFTVLGQVQRPGTFEIPSEESVDLLEAVAMAGGFTRLANTSKIIITRTIGGKKSTFVLDARNVTANGTAQVTVMPEDTITVAQRIL
jgi:polysaccharide export outer membrane protein